MAPRSSQNALKQLSDAIDAAAVYVKPLFHYGFIPAVVLIGMTCTSPQPKVIQLLTPM